jgi:hypothetical protein
MVDNTLALRGANPPVNSLGNFQQGMEAAASTEANRFKMAAATMEMIGSGAMYAMNGDINGEVDPKKYAEVIDSFEKMGIDVAQFRDNPNFAKVAAQASISALERLKLARSDRDYDLALQNYELELMKALQPKAPNVETIYDPDSGQEQKVIWSPEKGEYVPIGGKKAPSGTKFSLTQPDGTTIEFGEGNMPLGKTATNQVDERALNAAELGARLGQIASDFKPEYQTLGTKFSNLVRSGKASLDPSLLDPAEKQELTNFAEYRSGAIENLNTILKEMSGAAVTPQEFERIKAVMPNAGTGLFDGDDPVTFQAKLERAMTDTDKALARYQYYKAAGIPGSIDAIPLTDVQKVDGEWYIYDRKADKVYKIGEKPAEAK